jgi:hypothetical protein
VYTILTLVKRTPADSDAVSPESRIPPDEGVADKTARKIAHADGGGSPS